MKKMKRIISSVLAALLLFTGIPFSNETSELSSVYAKEANSQITSYAFGDFNQLEGHEITGFTSTVSNASNGQIQQVSAKQLGAKYTFNWGGYGSTYYYKKLSSSEKALYKYLKNLSLNYLNNANGYTNCYKSSGYCFVEPFYATSLTPDQIVRVMNIFTYSNPQYYFYDHGYIYGTDTYGGLFFAPTVYKKFASASKRYSATKKVNKTLTNWVNSIKSQSGYVNKIAQAQALICKKVKYGNSKYDQSCYSVFCGKRTVCAGYASAFTVLCEASGIPTILLTSDITYNGVYYGHAWNMVKIKGKWYNMDVTWDDLDSKYGDISGDGQVDAYYFEYTLRNDQNFIYDTNYQLTGDLTSYLSHYASSDWEYYGIPKAKRDSNPSGRYYTTIGTI